VFARGKIDSSRVQKTGANASSPPLPPPPHPPSPPPPF